MSAPWQRHGGSADSREVSQLVLSRTVEKERDAVVLLMKHNDHDSTCRPEWTVGRESLITKLGDVGFRIKSTWPPPSALQQPRGHADHYGGPVEDLGDRAARLAREEACLLSEELQLDYQHGRGSCSRLGANQAPAREPDSPLGDRAQETRRKPARR